MATMGPAVADLESVRSLVEAGMDVARLNFSHGDHDSHVRLIKWIRQAAADEDVPLLPNPLSGTLKRPTARSP